MHGHGDSDGVSNSIIPVHPAGHCVTVTRRPSPSLAVAAGGAAVSGNFRVAAPTGCPSLAAAWAPACCAPSAGSPDSPQGLLHGGLAGVGAGLAELTRSAAADGADMLAILPNGSSRAESGPCRRDAPRRLRLATGPMRFRGPMITVLSSHLPSQASGPALQHRAAPKSPAQLPLGQMTMDIGPLHDMLVGQCTWYFNAAPC